MAYYEMLHRPASEFEGITVWINSQPLTISSPKGLIVFLDFWTYSRINCVRSIPRMRELFAKYRDKALACIGGHNTEFGFERKAANVERAVKNWQ